MPGRRQLSKQELDYKAKRMNVMGPWYGRALMTLAMSAPVGVGMWGLGAFAGKTTDLKINAVVSVSVTANLMVGEAYRRKSNAMRDQSAELNRLRGRLENLEIGPPTKKGGRT